jgi:hypothetical protein
MKRLEDWQGRARQLKVEVYALYLAYRDPRVPLYARVFAACVVGYAFSPIDLIPAPVLAECREQARKVIEERPTNWAAAAVIVTLWLSLAALAILLVARVI